ncbi:TetR/AcrR family transcriptional regulator [Solwaraspora sp. WMMD1047]|uniref:TetR/AcrR family transcriptional regulator n=1 Tax=Solwaraspora sp. WMMD1047 TaxID=3016102 RepID=UPI002417F225|nr:TetR/AcrR family transcriptional regulator [Solwaraspora sp. WMMD1047]MDG4828278.1 TetR/AcrR family transcriptional regulator [Solwaraspora sp. WMMD1047]
MDRSVKYRYPRDVARPREFDEKAVLDAAREQFWAKGYAGTSMDAIAAATGLGKGSLYGAFGGKRQLFLRIFDAYCARIADAVTSGLTGPDDQAYARLCAHIRAAAAGVAADSRHRGCLLAKGAAELSEHDLDVTTRSRRTLEGIATALADDIRIAQRRNDLDPAADADQLAALVVAVLRGIEALGKAGIDADRLEGIAETAIALLPRTDKERETDVPTGSVLRMPQGGQG